MSKFRWKGFYVWFANYINDPDNDFELTLELLYDNEDVAVIKQGKNENELEMIWFAHKKDIVVPVDLLLKLLNNAKRDLKKYVEPED